MMYLGIELKMQFASTAFLRINFWPQVFISYFNLANLPQDLVTWAVYLKT